MDNYWYHMYKIKCMHDAEITRLRKLLQLEQEKSCRFSPYPTEIPPSTRSSVRKAKRVYREPTPQEADKILLELRSVNSIRDIIEFKNGEGINKLRWCSSYIDKLVRLSYSFKKMDEMVGMNEIKQSLFDNIFPLMIDMKGEEDFYHTVISGPPGTGKTALGRILCNLFHDLDIIPENKFILASRDMLIGEYLGQTAVKTQEVINKAIGGVLFIDEAYSLGCGSNRDMYSKECLDTINKNLSENRDKFICIIAGYKDALENDFFKSNDGLKRRFGFWYNISGYSSDRLYQILMLKLRKTANLKINLEDKDTHKIKELFKDVSKFPYYGGSIEKLLQMIKLIYSKHRVINNKKELDIADITEGYNLYLSNYKLEKNKNDIFSMLYL